MGRRLDESEEEDAQQRRKQQLVFLNTNKTGNEAIVGGAAAATGRTERPLREGHCYMADVGGPMWEGRGCIAVVKLINSAIEFYKVFMVAREQFTEEFHSANK